MPAARSQGGRPRGAEGAGLLDVARQMFLDSGFAGTTMADVATRARVSKSSLYRDFPSKDSLFEAVISDWVQRGRNALHPHVDALLAADDLEAALRRFASVLQAGVLADPVARVRRVVMAEAQHFPAVARAYAESWDRNVEMLADTFAELMRRGSLIQHDPEVAARQFTWLVLADPLNARSLGPFSDQLDAERLAATADEAVETFGARFLVGPGAQPRPYPSDHLHSAL